VIRERGGDEESDESTEADESDESAGDEEQ
jgi:hypothetical protein